MAHIVGLLFLQSDKQNVTPSRSSHNQRGVASRKSLIDRLHEVLPRRDILQVHKHSISAKQCRQVIAQTTCIRSRVLAPVADEDVTRDGSLRNCSDTIPL